MQIFIRVDEILLIIRKGNIKHNISSISLLKKTICHTNKSSEKDIESATMLYLKRIVKFYTDITYLQI